MALSNSTITIQQIVHTARAYPELTPIFGTSGWTQEPAVSIANDVMQKFLAQNFDWKFNRAIAGPFLTVALQQDYIALNSSGSTLIDMGWLEQGWRVDINNSAVPQPVFGMETVRDLARTSYQANPFNISWVPIPIAQYGTWQANTIYPSGLNQPFTPASPIQQFIDSNGNFLYVSTYGTSGNSQPAAGPNATPGTTVSDGSVVWTVADPRGIAIRLAPLPATSGLVWQISPIYQKKPPIITSLQNTITPIPDDYGYLFRQGFIALCMQHAGSKQFQMMYQQWQEDLVIALRSADREREDAVFYPDTGLMGGGPWKFGLPIGPGWPFDYWGQ